jgi:hypothetical protein
MTIGMVGGMSGENGDAVCQMSYIGYIWFKALWAGATAAIAYPHIFVVSTLHYTSVPSYSCI